MVLKEIKLGMYVDFNKTELKDLSGVHFYNKKHFVCKCSLKDKDLIKEFCNKLNKAKVYEVVLREVK